MTMLIRTVFFCLVLIPIPLVAKTLKCGEFPPDDLGTKSTGESVRISDYRGKLVIVTFWASWCEPCRKELPLLNAIVRTAPEGTIEVFAVNTEDAKTFSTLQDQLKDTALTLVSDVDGKLKRKFGVKAIPYMLIIGRDGRIGSKMRGYSEKYLPDIVSSINEVWVNSSCKSGADESD